MPTRTPSRLAAARLALAAGGPAAAEEVPVPGAGHPLTAYLARPAGESRGAVVLVHETFGLSAWISQVADRLAASGYTAVAPDLRTGLAPDGGGTAGFPSGDAVTGPSPACRRSGSPPTSMPPSPSPAPSRAAAA